MTLNKATIAFLIIIGCDNQQEITAENDTNVSGSSYEVTTLHHTPNECDDAVEISVVAKSLCGSNTEEMVGDDIDGAENNRYHLICDPMPAPSPYHDVIFSACFDLYLIEDSRDGNQCDFTMALSSCSYIYNL